MGIVGEKPVVSACGVAHTGLTKTILLLILTCFLK